jgi:arylsulfatase A-like enzyme
MLKKPNLLLISIDSLRPDHLSAYGYDCETTPYLTELAMQGVLFRNAFSASNWTGSAVASMLTGRYPTCHGYTNERYYLDSDVPTLAEQLQRAGYRTAGFSNNLYITQQTGLHRGFDRFYYRGRESAANGPVATGQRQTAAGRALKRRVPLAVKMAGRDALDLLIREKSLSRDDGALATEQAVCRWLQVQEDKPSFTFIHYQEPHSPYFPPKPFRKRFFPAGWLQQWHYLHYDPVSFYGGEKSFTPTEMKNYQALYDGEIAYLDWRMGRLFDFMRQHGLMEQTVVLVTADHGECFGENGYIWHAFNLYESLIRVPLILCYEPWFTPNRIDDRLVQSVDILATFLHGLGIAAEENNGLSLLSGQSREAVYLESDAAGKMVQRWLQKKSNLRESDFAQYLRDLRCYRNQEAKIIWASDGQHEFYDLAQDPAEQHNLWGQDPRADSFVNQLHNWHSQLKPHESNKGQAGVDKATWEKLKVLGYA